MKTELEKAIKNKEPKVNNIVIILVNIKNACCKFITKSIIYTKILKIRCLNEWCYVLVIIRFNYFYRLNSAATTETLV